MILDSSVIVQILLREDGWRASAQRLYDAPALACGAPVLVEAGMVLAARVPQGEVILRLFVVEMKIRVLPFETAHWTEAVRAFLRYGRGRHVARLNFGDCLSYATAKLAGMPLAYVGEDFGLTDLPTWDG